MYHFVCLIRYYSIKMLTQKEYNETIDLLADDIYRFALSCSRDPERGRDAVQEAFMRLWEHRAEMGPDDCKKFLLTVTRNKLIDNYRHEKASQTAHHFLATRQETRTSPADNYDLTDALQNAMNQLTETQRTIINLHDIEGYDYSEIASMMKIKYRQVQVYAFRARVKMKKILISQGIQGN